MGYAGEEAAAARRLTAQIASIEELVRRGQRAEVEHACAELETELEQLHEHPLTGHVRMRLARVQSFMTSPALETGPLDLPSAEVGGLSLAQKAQQREEQLRRRRRDERTRQWAEILRNLREETRPPQILNGSVAHVPHEEPCRLVTREALAAVDAEAGLDDIHCAAHPLASASAAVSTRTQGDATRARLSRQGMSLLSSLEAGSAPFAPSCTDKLRSRPLRSWQGEALQAWTAHGRHGVIEAVTGTGKTRVGVEAIQEALRDGMAALVSVPSKALMDQWAEELRQLGLPVELLGDGHSGEVKPGRALIATVHSLAAHAPAASLRRDALLVVDECHRSGAETFARTLLGEYPRRLGLTATFERSDDGIADLLNFFGGSPVFRIGYDRAIRENIVAHYVVATVGVNFTKDERFVYDEAESTCRDARLALVRGGVQPRPFGEYMKQVASIASDSGHVLNYDAKRFLSAFSRRAQILSSAAAKQQVLESLEPALRTARGTLIFSMRVADSEATAVYLQGRGIDVKAIHGGSGKIERQAALREFRLGRIAGLSAPRILDEGIDVPEADLGIITATSQRRLQMIQRMGRVLRLKDDGRRARLVLAYVRDSAEDPTGPEKAHEAFFNEVLPTADAHADFGLEDRLELAAFLTETHL